MGCNCMKRNKWIISLVIISVVFVLTITCIIIMINKGYGISTGQYLEAKDGQALLIRDNSPIEMSNRTERELFDELDMGDMILVIHDGIAETYPGRTGVYAIFKLSNGTIDDIPKNVVNQLMELGWLETIDE